MIQTQILPFDPYDSYEERAKQLMLETDITPDEHYALLHYQLGQKVRAKTSIYLDTNFWVDITESERTPKNNHLLTLLRQAVHSGIAFCPISSPHIPELFKQECDESRSITASLMNELCANVILLPNKMRLLGEIANELALWNIDLIHAQGRMLTPTETSIWSAPGNLIGIVSLETASDEPFVVAHSKIFIEHHWRRPLIDVINTMDREGFQSDYDRVKSLADAMNQIKKQPREEIKKFKDMYKLNLDLWFNTERKQISYLINQAMRMRGHSLSEKSITNRTNGFIGNLIEKLSEGDQECRRRFRTAHIMGALFASMFWNRDRVIEANDIYDFEHAFGAVAYCDVFFTERSLRATLSENHVQIGERFGCKIIKGVDNAIEYMEELIRSHTQF